MNERMDKIEGIIFELLTIHRKKKCHIEICPPMCNGQFHENCHDCAYYILSKKIEELKKEVQKNEPT